MISICKDINEVTPSDAVFIQPFENTELKFFAQRSSYVEFKANVRNKKFVGDWYDRIQLVFDVSAENTEKGFALQQKANENYYTENRWVLSSRAGQGISYMLVKKNYAPPFGTKILENNSYAVYQL